MSDMPSVIELISCYDCGKGVSFSAANCPHCGSTATRETAAFSGTACKALYRCESCQEPFEYVKDI